MGRWGSNSVQTAFQNHGKRYHLGGLRPSCVSPLPRRPADWRDRTDRISSRASKLKSNLTWPPSLSASGYPDDRLHISINWPLLVQSIPRETGLSECISLYIKNALFTLYFRRSNHHKCSLVSIIECPARQWNFRRQMWIIHPVYRSWVTEKPCASLNKETTSLDALITKIFDAKCQATKSSKPFSLFF